jgi:Fe-S-cluster containining protein
MDAGYRERIVAYVRDRRQIAKKLLALKKWRPGQIDAVFHKAHREAFEETDCLRCANCCLTTSPIFTPDDIDRLSAAHRLSSSAFIDRYLTIDKEDGHFMLCTSPCPFLKTDNYCSVYESRPRACKGFPHTDRRNVHEIMPIILKNAEICPAVALMLMRIASQI